MQIYKAHPMGDIDAPALRLEATEPLPQLPDYEDLKSDMRKWEQAHRDRYMEQGKLILSALIQSLPGGTIDALLACLLEHRRMLLIVPYLPPGQPVEAVK